MNELYVLKYAVNRCGEIESPEIVVGDSKKVLEELVKDYNERNVDCDRVIEEYAIEVVDLESLSSRKVERLF